MSAQKHTDQEQLAELQAGLALKPHEIPVAQIIPLLVPASFFDRQQWPGPYSLLRASGVGLTWAALMPKQTMLYVSHPMTEYWNSQNLNWRQQAIDNLGRLTGNPVATAQFNRADGQVYGLVMMHEDGCGPSRLLLDQHIAQWFPEGYRVAVPEMSVGLAFSVRLSEAEQKKMEGLVHNCFQKGTRPVSSSIFESSELVAASHK